MKTDRAKNASRNVVFGTFLKLYQTVIPFLMRTAMIYFMGVEYLGLNSLFTSILQVLNLAELGVGSAMVYSMYKPIAEDDGDTICTLLNLYKKYYLIIGTVIAAAGSALTPFIPSLIKSDLPPGLNIYVLYLLNLGATVFSYWFLAYKGSLLQAHQRSDVTSKITLITNTIQFVLQFIVIVFREDYYYYVMVSLGTQVLTNLAVAFVAMKMYPNYVPKGKFDKETKDKINRRIKDLLTSKIGGVIVNSADTIVISAFLGLTMLAVYQNYYFILAAVINFISIIFASCTAGIGNSVIVESKEKNFYDLERFTMIIVWLAGFCTCCFLCLYQPFMQVWVGDKLMLEDAAVICFCIYFFVFQINQLLNLYKDAAGIWHQDRFRPLVTALSNLTMNLITVNFWGIYGVILSTVVSTLVIGMPWLLHNLFTCLFEKKYLGRYLRKLGLYVLVVLFSCLACYGLCYIIPFTGLPLIAVRLVICAVIANIIYFVAFRKTKEFAGVKDLVRKVLKRK